jgi:hypothetical protein
MFFLHFTVLHGAPGDRLAPEPGNGLLSQPGNGLSVFVENQ